MFSQLWHGLSLCHIQYDVVTLQGIRKQIGTKVCHATSEAQGICFYCQVAQPC